MPTDIFYAPLRDDERGFLIIENPCLILAKTRVFFILFVVDPNKPSGSIKPDVMIDGKSYNDCVHFVRPSAASLKEWHG
ncbi:hypothetical protein BFX06_00940 [Sulfobacillus thermosulfidooxidans]|nr:hypothetical protein BFX05_02800 [Sulfobacillus thermosulfidooxidans]OLZ17330.1 hypothetical protein BFX06_00940 [Sulfobacillus thermosulfidooxidans]OLZ19353.1 hypothetical protein BFX07_03355 [Sulfobacillus thermosulfidooxidans]